MQKNSGNVFPGIKESDFFIFSQGWEMGGAPQYLFEFLLIMF